MLPSQAAARRESAQWDARALVTVILWPLGREVLYFAE